MRAAFTIFVLCVSISAIYGQASPQGPTQTALEQALSRKLLNELDLSVQCTSNLIVIQQQLVAAQSELEKTKAKLAEFEKKGIPQ